MLSSMSIALMGCAQLLDAGEYTNTRADAGERHDAAPEQDEAVLEAGAWPIDPGTLFDPKPPYMAGDECKACIDQHCQEDNAECSTNDFCRSWLNEARAQNGPLTTAYALQRKYEDARWASDHGEASDWQRLTSLQRCATEQCGDACGIGRDFSCVGKFDWPASYPEQTRLRIRAVDGFDRTRGYDDFSVRACVATGYCTPPLGEGKTVGGGFAEISIDLSLSVVGRPPEFSGLVELKGPPEFFLFQEVVSRPLLDETYLNLSLFNKATYSVAAERAGFPLDGSRALLAIRGWECSTYGARQVTFEVWTLTNGVYRLCPSPPRDQTWDTPKESQCGPLYTGEGAIPDTTLTEVVQPSRLGYAWTVGSNLIVMRDRSTGFPLSAHKLLNAQGGTVVNVDLHPASKKQLLEFPREIWTLVER